MRKYYYLIIALFAVLSAGMLAAQEEDVPSSAESAEPESDADQSDEPEEPDEFDDFDDSDLDEQTYEEDDDDFVPTEEIPVDIPIPFPTNI